MRRSVFTSAPAEVARGSIGRDFNIVDPNGDVRRPVLAGIDRFGSRFKRKHDFAAFITVFDGSGEEVTYMSLLKPNLFRVYPFWQKEGGDVIELSDNVLRYGQPTGRLDFAFEIMADGHFILDGFIIHCLIAIIEFYVDALQSPATELHLSFWSGPPPSRLRLHHASPPSEQILFS